MFIPRIPSPRNPGHWDSSYGLNGVMTFTVSGQPKDIAAGQTCYFPRGAVHGFNNL
jgi:quercetin dioxygenase-like cupin family protein